MVIKDFSNFPTVESEMRVGEVDSSENKAEDDEVGIIISLGHERIVSHFVAERLIMKCVFFIKGMTARVTIENVLMTEEKGYT